MTTPTLRKLALLLSLSATAALAQEYFLSVPVRAAAQDFGRPVPTAWLATEGGIFRSNTPGPDWSNIYIRPAGQVQPAIKWIFPDPANPQVVYFIADLDDGGIWKTTDAGRTFRQLNSGLPATGAIDAFLPHTGLQTIYLKTGTQLFKSTDAAETWALRSTLPQGARVIDVNPADPRQMVTAYNNAVYRTRDEGANWTLAQVLNLSSQSNITAVMYDRADPTIAHLAVRGPAGSRAGFYRSPNGADRFDAVSPSELPRFEPTAFVTDPAGKTIFASSAEEGIVYRSEDKGTNWFRLNRVGAGPNSLSLDPGDPRVVLAATGAGLFFSNNNGASWISRIGPARPTLAVPAASLDFTLPPGSTGRLQAQVRILETQQWTLPISISASSEPWLNLSGTAVNTPASPIVTVNTADLPLGNYTGSLRVDAPLAGNSPLQFPIRLSVIRPRPLNEAFRITPFAGSGLRGNFGDGSAALRAAFGDLDSVAVDRDGNVFLSDPVNNIVRRIGVDGVISRYAGNNFRGDSGDGAQANIAQLNFPTGLAIDNSGALFISDTGNRKIRRVAPDGTISTLASNVGGVRGLAIARDGSLLVAVPSDHIIGRVTMGGQTTVLAGEVNVAGFRGDGGLAAGARFNAPQDVFVDARGLIYITDTGNHRIRRIDDKGVIETIAGSGIEGYQGEGDARRVAFSSPDAVAVDASSGQIFIADAENHRIRRIDPATGQTRTIAGTGVAGFGGDNGPATLARISGVRDIAFDRAGALLSVEAGNLRIRRLIAPPPPVLPVITEGPINWADDSPRLAPGTIFRIRGTDLAAAAEEIPTGSATWPIDLGGVRVTLNTTALPLMKVSPEEIIGLIPTTEAAGPASLTVTRDDVAGAPVNLLLETAAPAWLLAEPGRALASNEDGGVNSFETPASLDSLVTVYFTGSGDLTLPAELQAGDVAVEVVRTRLTPGRNGVAEVQFRVPAGATPGPLPLVLRLGSALTNSALIYVQ